MTPTFSIIIPVYNVAPYLRECLDSVLAQTFIGWEAICVDDGSTDGSGAILDEYAGKDSRFKVIHQANAGVSAARNAALEVARGDWICFLDADDYFEKNHLGRFIMCKCYADVNFLPVRFYNADGSVKSLCGPVVECIEERNDFAQFVRALIYSDTGYNLFGYTWNKFIRASLIINNHIRFVEKLSVSEDEVFAFSCLVYAQSISSLSETGYCYRWHGAGLTHAKRKNYSLLTDSFLSLTESFLERGLKELVSLRLCETLSVQFAQDKSWRSASLLLRKLLDCSLEDKVVGRRKCFVKMYARFTTLAIALFYVLCRVSRSYGMSLQK